MEHTEELVLDIKDLVIHYVLEEETVCAVNGIDVKLGRGKILGLVGETGAGKTTTALAIMRLLPFRTGQVLGGSIEFDGVSLLDIPESEMRKTYRGDKIGMIFQDPMTALNPVTKVGDQIGEALKYHNKKATKSEIDKRVEEMLEMVGIPGFRKNDYPHQFSGGMKQRVVIAIALACEPDLLIADEPTTALDVTIQAQVLAMMSGLQERLKMSMIPQTVSLIGTVSVISGSINTYLACFESKKYFSFVSSLTATEERFISDPVAAIVGIITVSNAFVTSIRLPQYRSYGSTSIAAAALIALAQSIAEPEPSAATQSA